MGSMTDERRKEMEEEMMRFEQEIAFPADECPPGETKVKPLPPPPCPPDLGKIEKKEEKENEVKTEEVEEEKVLKDVLPEVLTKPPPPPPPPDVQQKMSASVNHQPPPGPPPSMMGPEFPRMQGPRMPPMPGPPVHMAGGHIQFIPHQLQRHPPRPPPAPPRPPMMQMRPLPGGFPPGPLPFPMHGPPMLPPMHMPLPPMGMPIPMGPGFCHPPPPAMSMRPMHMGPMNVPSQPFVPTSAVVNFHQPTHSSSKREDRTITSKVIIKSEPELAAAPAVYAAPPMKSLSDKMAENSAVVNGQNTTHNVSNNPSVQQQQQQMEEPKSAKTAEESVAAATTPIATNTEPVATKKEKKKKKVIRMAGGQAWEDNSLIDWDPDDFRIFCGDLGNDVTDEVLIRAFSKYSSFVKAKVIRDKRTNKTKGYGFVSFKDPQDFIKAMREMNGRYVGSRPIKLRKSTWRDRNIELVRKKQKEKEKLGLL